MFPHGGLCEPGHYFENSAELVSNRLNYAEVDVDRDKCEPAHKGDDDHEREGHDD